MLRLLLAASAALLASCTASPPSPPSPERSPVEQFVGTVHRTVLPNGLTVLAREQRGSGVVAINTWVKAGYFNEPDEVAGMAHLFEHMFFKGSQAYPGPEAIAQAISAAGGSSNAGTIYDSTNYYVVVPKESFAAAVAVEADAIARPLFDPAELRKEAEVVIEESNRKLDNPPAVALERMLAVSYTQHRVRRWRIGSNEVLRNIRRENLLAFFETLYRPENIVVTVAGDVTPAEALAAVQAKFGGIPRGTLRKERGPQEPAQDRFRFGRSEADIKEGYTVLGWHTVPENHADEVTLEVLAAILGGGRSSRFYRAAVGPQAASTVAADHFTFDDVGVFSVTASEPEAHRGEVERRLVAEVERMKRYGPTPYELQQARNASDAAFLRGIDTGLEQAQALSRAEARGSYRDLVKQQAQLAALTADEVRDAARRYLALDKLTLYHYQPKGAAAMTEAEAHARVEAAARVEVAAPEAAPLPDVRNTVRVAAGDAPPRTFTLSNGAQLVVQQRGAAPLVSTAILFKGGRTQESAANAGITRLMLGTLRRGTGARSGAAIDRELGFLGAQLAPFAADDGFGFQLEATTAAYEPALDVVADVLLHPAFSEQGVALEKAVQAAAIKRQLDSSAERPMQLYRAALFGDHPYGLPDLGTEASVAALDRAKLEAWWRASIAADRAMVVVVGNVDAEDARRVIEARLAALPRSAAPLRAVPPAPRLARTVENVEQRDRKQTALVIAFPAVPPSHADWPALRLLQSITSGLSGTFHAELRGRQSLAYVVYARPVAFAREGTFVGYIACEASKEAAARRGLLDEMHQLRGEGVKAADVERAKAYFSGSTRIARERNASLATEYAGDYMLGLPLDHVDRLLDGIPRLTPDAVRAAAGRYLATDDYVYAAVRGR